MFQDLHPSLRNVMYAVLLSFVALMAATFYTVRLTFQNFEPVIDKNYYELGLNYEKVIKDQKLLLAEGYSLELKIGDGALILPVGKQTAVVRILKDNKLSPASSVQLILERSATTKSTVSYNLKADAEGKFVGEIIVPAGGNWNTRAIADIAGKKFEKQGLISAR
jgi:hypothetical protein